MSQTLLQRQLSHTPFPEFGSMGMAQGVGGDPRLTHTKPLAVPLEEFDQGMVAQRLTAPLSLSANQKQVGTDRLLRALRHHIVAHRLQCLGLMEIHHPFCPRFGSYSFRVISTIADR